MNIHDNTNSGVCVGGPYDGQRHTKRGNRFRCFQPLKLTPDYHPPDHLRPQPYGDYSFDHTKGMWVWEGWRD